MKNFSQNELAQIEYHGQEGITRECLNAIVRLLHFGNTVNKAFLISHVIQTGDHCFLLTVNEYNLIAIKSGFSSGYRGEGPYGLSMALQLLRTHGTSIEEYNVKKEIIQRINGSCLLKSDIVALEQGQPIRPVRYHDYIYEKHFDNKEKLIKEIFPLSIPLSLIDLRIIDLALNIKDQEDHVLLIGYRRLEDIVRSKTRLGNLSGVKLFSRAFQGDNSLLYWPNLDEAENKGRGQLFTGTFMTYRNRRAHKEPSHKREEVYREFLLLNELFSLESSAVLRNEQPE